MPENETVQQELKNATASYRNIPIWMKRIEKMMNSSKRQGTAQDSPIPAKSDSGNAQQFFEDEKVPVLGA